MTEAEAQALLKAAVDQTTISFDAFLQKVHAGMYTPDQLRATWWYKTGKAAELVKHATPAPPATGIGRRVVYFSNVTDFACARFAQLGPGYTARVTADPNPAYRITDAQIAVLKSGGGRVESWCDCHTTFPVTAKAMAVQRGLAGWSGEFESNGAWDVLVQNGATDAIGNPSVLSPDRLVHAIEASRNGTMRLIGEVMNPDPAYSAQGVDISSACYYVDRDDDQGGDLPVLAYLPMPAAQRATCSLYAAGVMSGADWDTFAAWTRP